MLLTIDAGNTRTKWAIFNELGEITQHDGRLNSDIDSADLSPKLLGYTRTIVSNVAGEPHAMHLADKLEPYHLPVYWVKSATQACHVINRYSTPETLGSDRWAALIAAWNIKHAPCVVVNAGTAVTIDALNIGENNHEQYGEFIGGWILPGLTLMQRSLGLATAQLPKLALAKNRTETPPTDIFATNTADAIYAGALHAIVGAITQMAHELKVRCKQAPFIVISGGNAPMIYQQLIKQNPAIEMTKQAVIVDNLVLQGLYLLEDFMQSDSQ